MSPFEAKSPFGRLAVILIVPLFLAAVFALTSRMPLAAESEFNKNDDGLAVHGYDVVAYFKGGEPEKGNPFYAIEHNGVTYQFASSANLEAFKTDPAKYIPAYGGYCSYGVRLGQKFDVDPNAWYIEDKRLFLQLNIGTQHVWLKEKTKNIDIADGLWPEIAPVPADKLPLK